MIEVSLIGAIKTIMNLTLQLCLKALLCVLNNYVTLMKNSVARNVLLMLFWMNKQINKYMKNFTSSLTIYVLEDTTDNKDT